MEENTIWLTIADTPWWIFGLFAYFLYVGYLATKPRIIHFRQLIAASSLFSGFSFFNFAFFIQPNAINLSTWAFCLLSACLFGFLQFRMAKIKAFKNEAKISLPGTYVILALTMVGIISKYYTNLRFNLSPETLKQPIAQQFLSAFYGAFNGYFAGKTYYAWRSFKHGPFVA